MTNVTKQLAVGDRFSMGPLTCEITKVDKFGNTPHYGFSYRIDTTGEAPMQSGWMPCFFVENYTGHFRGTEELRDQLSSCQLQNETNQAALERAGKLSEENFAQAARIRAMVREDVASLRRCVEMQRQRDLLLQAVAELIPFAKSEKLTSHKSFDRSEPFTRQSVVEFARAAVLETNVEVPGIEPGPDKSASETGAYSHAAGYQD